MHSNSYIIISITKHNSSSNKILLLTKNQYAQVRKSDAINSVSGYPSLLRILVIHKFHIFSTFAHGFSTADPRSPIMLYVPDWPNTHVSIFSKAFPDIFSGGRKIHRLFPLSPIVHYQYSMKYYVVMWRYIHYLFYICMFFARLSFYIAQKFKLNCVLINHNVP